MLQSSAASLTVPGTRRLQLRAAFGADGATRSEWCVWQVALLV